MSQTGDEVTAENHDPDGGDVTRQQWRWTVLGGMASYLDAGSIVALGSGLVFFQRAFGLDSGAVGLLTAIGPNAIGCAIGAFIGGRLGDTIGRKRIYQWDLLIYAAGILTIAGAVNAPMLFIGTFVVGLTVGADVPTSLALVGELAPAKARGKLLGFSQVAWNSGPVVVLVMAAALSPLGLTGIRIVFVQLAVVALVTWALRRGMTESARWKEASGRVERATYAFREIFRGANFKALAWTATIYVFWNLAAGTSGIYTPYMVSTLGGGSQLVSVGLSAAGFLIGIVATVTIFMPRFDRDHRTRKIFWVVGSIMQIVSYGMFLFLPFTIPVVIANVVLFAVGGALAGEAVYKVFSQELFPTMLRGTAQGFTFGVARLLLGVWSFLVPMITQTSFQLAGGLLALFLLISGVAGFFFMPNTAGKSLESIETERSRR